MFGTGGSGTVDDDEMGLRWASFPGEQHAEAGPGNARQDPGLPAADLIINNKVYGVARASSVLFQTV